MTIGNDALWRIKYYKDCAYETCSDSIKKLIQDFYIKCAKSEIKFVVDQNIEDLFLAASYFAQNTSKGEIIEGEDLNFIKKTMEVLEQLLAEIIKTDPNDKGAYYESKIGLISEIFCKNTIGMKFSETDENDIHKDKVFKRYRDLYFVIDLVNEHYDELLKRGFGLNSVWYPFWETVGRSSLSEDEKMQMFLGLINGTMKFQPVYEFKAVGYAITPRDYDETIIKNISTGYDTEKLLPEADVKFEIAGEGDQLRLVRVTK